MRAVASVLAGIIGALLVIVPAEKSWAFDNAADFTLQEPVPEFESYFGRSVASGDVNGDGKEDIIVGALAAFVQVGDQLLVAGEAFVFLGGQPFDQNADFTLRAPVPQDNHWFGQSVAAGDVNGDGKDDVIVGAPHPVCTNPPFFDVCFRGDAFVFLGGEPFDGTADFTLTDPTPNGLDNDNRAGFFGEAVTTGDVNGDGKEDVVVGAHSGSSPCCFSEGEAFVFLGATPFNATSDFALHGPSDVDMFGGQFGDALAAGDVNGDLKDDIVVGAPLAGPAFQGRAFAFLGGEPFDSVSDSTLQDPVLDDFAHFGQAVAVGDVTGDGKSEIIVGSQGGGGTLVYLGGAPFDAISDHTLGAGAFSLTTGDANGDLTDDLLVGQNTETVAGQSAAGRALLFLGGSPFDISSDFTLLDPNPEFQARFGHSLVTGDVNGDGVDDVMVGADASDVGVENEAGQAFVFLGGDVDTDGDTIPDSIDSNDDNDLFVDTAEEGCGSNRLLAASVPERLDTVGDDDGDTLVNEALPGGSAAYDCDGDGYAGTREANVTTSDQDPCGGSGWPSDLFPGTPGGFQYNTLNIQDLGTFIAPVRRYGTSPGNPNFSVRWDLVPGGTIGGTINLQDIAATITGASGYPPMLGTQKAFGKMCPYAP